MYTRLLIIYIETVLVVPKEATFQSCESCKLFNRMMHHVQMKERNIGL